MLFPDPLVETVSQKPRAFVPGTTHVRLSLPSLFYPTQDEVLLNDAIDKGFQQTLAVMTSQMYLGKLLLESKVMELVDYTVKGENFISIP